MKRPVISLLAAVASACLLASGLALASNSASDRSSESAALRFLKKVTLAAGSLLPSAQQGTLHTSTLNRPRVSKGENGRIVVSMEVQGDIHGDMTLILDTNSDGSISDGVWSLVSSYVESVPGVDGDGDGDGGERFVENGTLTGRILSGAITLNTDGSVGSLSGIQLEIKGGSLTFETVSQGNGIMNGSDLSDREAATGSLQLNF